MPASPRTITPRKTTPRVRQGRVQRKNHRDVALPSQGPVRIRLEVPRPGARHVVSESDLRRFFALIPGWDQLSAGLEEVVLADRDEDADGWYELGVIHLCAWDDPPHLVVHQLWLEAHREVLDLLGVRIGRPEWNHRGRCSPDKAGEIADMFDLDQIEQPARGPAIGFERDERGQLLATHELHARPDGVDVYERCFPCRFTPGQARAFSLLHVFLHELGHHRDCMRAPARGECIRGEEYAEHLALSRGSALFARYVAAFGL